MLVLIVLILALLQGTVFGVDCPSGWTGQIHSTKCIKGFEDRLTFMEAMEYCEAIGNGGAMVSLHNAFQNEQVATIVKETGKDCTGWIGLCNFDGSDAYSWIDETPLDYQNWAPGYPLSSIEDTMIYMDPSVKNKWLSTDELLDSKCVVCEQNSGQGAQTTAASLSTSGGPSACESGWILYDKHCYFYSSLKRSWSAAVRICLVSVNSTKQHKARLLSIHSQAEMDFVKGHFTNSDYWIGLRRLGAADPWRWNDGTILDYKNWASGNPSSADATNCAALTGSAGEWSNGLCDDKRNFVCKYTSS